ncbi:MAG: condensation domain-containing protein, partial [Archangium sp.]
VAYLVAQEGQTLETAALRAFLKQTLPEYMVPSVFMTLEALPLTPTKKVDRKALPAPKVEGADLKEYVEPRTALERLVADIWAPLLGVRQVGARDHFFELGGHSLLAAQVVSRLREALGVEVPVRVLFEASTVEQLAQRLESMVGGKQGPQVPPLVPMPRSESLPLSFAQRRLWFIEQLEPGSFAYNVPFFLRLKGRLDVGTLERSLAELVRRHEALRTTFASVEGQPVQRIAPELALALPVESLAELAGEERQKALQQRAEEEARGSFDLEKGPLVRAKLLRLAEDEHVLALVMHHIISDGWSLRVLVQEVAALYRALASGAEPSLPELPVQYADYAVWQREWLKGEVLEEQLAWWKKQLAGAPSVLELPADRPRPPVQTFRGALLRMRLPEALMGAVRELNRREGVTSFMTSLAAFQVLLARYSGQTDIVVGTSIAGRHRKEVEKLIGFFANTLALRVEASGETSFRELLKKVKEVALGAYAHQDVPFEQLVGALQPVRDLSRPPLFQVAFVLLEAPPALELPGASMEVMDIDPGMAKFDLTLYMRESAEGVDVFWEYNTDLYDEGTVVRMAGHYVRLLESAVARP